MQKQIDPNQVLIAICPDHLVPVETEFNEVDMTTVLNWFLSEELDILVFSAAIES